MLNFIIGFLIGGLFGIVIIALCMAAKKTDEQMEDKNEWLEYRCELSIMKDCDNMCCYNCIGKEECKFACKGYPKKCGHSIVDFK